MNPLLVASIDQLQYLNSGEIFLVKDLFKGYEWNRIPTNERINLGTLFINHIKDNPQLNITILPKTSSNQQKYRKN